MAKEFNVREAIAESGKTSIKDIMNYLASRHSGKYNVKEAKEEAKEMVKEMKSYMQYVQTKR